MYSYRVKHELSSKKLNERSGGGGRAQGRDTLQFSGVSTLADVSQNHVGCEALEERERLCVGKGKLLSTAGASKSI